MEPLLDVQDLTTRFYTRDGVVHAVNGVSFQVAPRETLGIVGESGCGKTVSLLSVMRLVPSPPGKVEGGKALLEGKDLLRVSDEEIRKVRGNKISMIFQDPMTSLNPVLTIGRQVSEALELHLGMSKSEARKRTIELLELVGIPDAASGVDNYPHQFSGGMRQRVMIAMGLSCNPQLLIADEPTTALDVTIQAQIIDLVKRLQDDLGMAIIWITHDLGIVAGLVDRLIVMYAGYVVESGGVNAVYGDPRHPYTLGLLRSIPRLDAEVKEKLTPIEGLPPDLVSLPQGCPFQPRCNYRVDRCGEEIPGLREVGEGHKIACWVDVRGLD